MKSLKILTTALFAVMSLIQIGHSTELSESTLLSEEDSKPTQTTPEMSSTTGGFYAEANVGVRVRINETTNKNPKHTFMNELRQGWPLVNKSEKVFLSNGGIYLSMLYIPAEYTYIIDEVIHEENKN